MEVTSDILPLTDSGSGGKDLQGQKGEDDIMSSDEHGGCRPHSGFRRPEC